MTIAADLQFVKCAAILLENGNKPDIQCPAKWTPLRYSVVKNQNLKMVKLLLEHEADPNAEFSGDSVLTMAAAHGDLEIVKILVDKRALIDAANDEGFTALQKAAENGHKDVTEYLLNCGADIDHRSNAGGTALTIAANNTETECVRLLIERGANIHLAPDNGWAPINLTYDDPAMTRLLMEKGANANLVCAYFTPIFLASTNNFIETVKVLLEFKVDLEIPCANPDYRTGFTALTCAVSNNNLDMARVLLEGGANINHKSENVFFPLMIAVRDGHDEMAKLLLEYNPNINLKDYEGDTALNYIPALNLTRILVNAGADIETRNNLLYTPITKAALEYNNDTVEYLITKKANLNPVGGKHGAPIHIACRWGNMSLLKILVKAGADTNLVNNSTCGNPLQSAARYWNAEDNRELQEQMIRYLLEEGKADVNVIGGTQGCALNAMCGWCRPDMVKLMLDSGAKINVQDEMGRGALHLAVLQDVDNFQMVVSAGGDINVCDKMGRTVLHWAVLSGSLEIVERVLGLEKGLLDKRDGDGWTPLLWACRGGGTAQKGVSVSVQKQIIEYLLEQGADIGVVGRGIEREWTPIKVARYHDVDAEILDMLVAETKEKGQRSGKAWNESVHASQKAGSQVGSCDSCFIVSSSFPLPSFLSNLPFNIY